MSAPEVERRACCQSLLTLTDGMASKAATKRVKCDCKCDYNDPGPGNVRAAHAEQIRGFDVLNRRVKRRTVGIA